MKAKTLCRFYSLDQDPEEYSSIAKIYKIKSIKLTAIKNGKKYIAQIVKSSDNNFAYLPSVELYGKNYSQGEYKI